MKTGPTARQVQQVFTRSQGLCELCGSQGEQLHHRKPRAMGGSKDPSINSPANLLHLCLRCHAKIESNREWARRDGLLVRLEHSPATTPVVLLRGPTWLTSDGEYE